MSGIRRAFDHGKAFIAFLTCGDPDMETSEELIGAAAQAGADLIELGIPFSDPTAEGPVIRQANLRALSAGATTDGVLGLARRVRDKFEIPLVFMTYANVVFSYGTERFAGAAAEAGIDGLILPDVPYEERGEFASACRRHGLDLISLVAPTSNERIGRIAGEAEGFVYCVSSLGVTGPRSGFPADLDSVIGRIRSATAAPIAVGFGVSTPEQAAEMAAKADGVIVGSALVSLVGQYGREAAPRVSALIRAMKEAMRGAL